MTSYARKGAARAVWLGWPVLRMIALCITIPAYPIAFILIVSAFVFLGLLIAGVLSGALWVLLPVVYLGLAGALMRARQAVLNWPK